MAQDIVDIGLSVDSSEVKKGRNELDKLGGQAKKTAKATEELTAATKLMGAAILAASGAALASVINQHREFTKAISELSAITGATGADLKFYKEQALALGASTTFSAQQVATAFKLIASAKPDLLESKDALAAVTREVLTLAEASGLSLEDAARTLGGTLNQFGAGAEDAAKFINVLAAGAKLGSSEINETAEAMKNAGSVAASLGLSFEETNAAIQAMSAVSIKGAEAGTGLRGILLKLAKQARDDFNPEVVGLAVALKNLQDANLSTTEKMKIFEQESFNAATALIKQADAVGVLTEKLTGTQTAYEQARINTDNLDGDIKSMGSSFSNAALLLGDTFDPALRASVQLLTEIGKVISGTVLVIDDLGDVIGAYAAISAAALTGDFKAIKAINEAREEEGRLNREKLAGLFDEKKIKEEIAAIDKAAAAEKQKEKDEKAEVREITKRQAAEKAFLEENEKLKLAFQDRLQIIRDSQKTQAELDAEQFESDLAALDLHLERKIITEAEHIEALQALNAFAMETNISRDEREREIREQKLADEIDWYDREIEVIERAEKLKSDARQKEIDEQLKQQERGKQAFEQYLSAAASGNKKFFEIQKIYRLSKIAMEAPGAIADAYAWGVAGPLGPAGGVAAAAITAAAMGAYAAQIAGSSFGGTGSGGVSSASTVGAAPLPSVNEQPVQQTQQQAGPTFIFNNNGTQISVDDTDQWFADSIKRAADYDMFTVEVSGQRGRVF